MPSIFPGAVISVGNVTGTCGAFFRLSNKPNSMFFSTCWHVVPGFSTAKKIPVNTLPIGSGTPLPIGFFKKSTLPAVSGLDFSLIEILPMSEFSLFIKGTNDLSFNGFRSAKKGDELWLSGGFSTYSKGVVEHTDNAINGVRFGVKIRVTSPNHPVHGDSGGIWYDPNTLEAVAYNSRHFPNDAMNITAGDLAKSMQRLNESVPIEMIT